MKGIAPPRRSKKGKNKTERCLSGHRGKEGTGKRRKEGKCELTGKAKKSYDSQGPKEKSLVRQKSHFLTGKERGKVQNSARKETYL